MFGLNCHVCFQVIRQNESFARCATVFKRMMRTVRSNPSAYATDGATPKRFEYLMQRLEGDLMDDLVFQNCLRQPFEHQGLTVPSELELFGPNWRPLGFFYVFLELMHF